MKTVMVLTHGLSPLQMMHIDALIREGAIACVELPDEAGTRMTAQDLIRHGQACFVSGKLAAEFERAHLEADVKHWKANHANLRMRLRILTQRPDLPFDRLPEYVRMVQQIEDLQAEVVRLRGAK